MPLKIEEEEEDKAEPCSAEATRRVQSEAQNFALAPDQHPEKWWQREANEDNGPLTFFFSRIALLI
jgi:hypothetical protein